MQTRLALVAVSAWLFLSPSGCRESHPTEIRADKGAVSGVASVTADSLPDLDIARLRDALRALDAATCARPGAIEQPLLLYVESTGIIDRAVLVPTASGASADFGGFDLDCLRKFLVGIKITNAFRAPRRILMVSVTRETLPAGKVTFPLQLASRDDAGGH